MATTISIGENIVAGVVVGVVADVATGTVVGSLAALDSKIATVLFGILGY